MATNILKFCKAGIANWVAFVVGVFGVDCAACRIYTRFGSREGTSGSGLLLGGAVTLGSKSMGIG